MLSALAFISLAAFAGHKPAPAPAPKPVYTFTYATQIVAGQASCATEAQQLAQRFSQATGAKVEQALCRSEENLSAEGKSYKAYNLGLTYKSESPYYPYTVLIGKETSGSVVRFDVPPVYPSMDSCLADLAAQTEAYAAQTGLNVTTATCALDKNYIEYTQYVLKIEGFDNSPYHYAQPQKSLYVFSPFTYSNLRDARLVQVRDFITAMGAAIVKQANNSFIYYRAGGALPVNAESLGHFKNVNECEAQMPAAQNLYVKAGSPNMIVWCDEGNLEVLHEGNYYVMQVNGSSQSRYATFEQCVADQEFVMKDARNANAMGAICAPNTYDSSVYSLVLYTRGY